MEMPGNQPVTTIEGCFRLSSTRQVVTLVDRSVNLACQIGALPDRAVFPGGKKPTRSYGVTLPAKPLYGTGPRTRLGCHFSSFVPNSLNYGGQAGRIPTLRITLGCSVQPLRGKVTEAVSGALRNGRAEPRPYRLSDPRFRLIHIASL
jgi:hypothetical protein